MTTCTDCGYNLPHHDWSCRQAPKFDQLCPNHAPGRTPDRGSDDARLTCVVCGVNGQHVRYFLKEA